MAFLQIINDANFLEFITNDYAPFTDTKEAYVRKSNIDYITLSADETYIELGFNSGRKYQFTYQYPPISNNVLVVDSVDGIAPTNNDDLLHKIKNLI